MTYQADPYYVGGSLKIGTPPSAKTELPSGRMSNAEILSGFHYLVDVTKLRFTRTAHNELTFDADGTTTVRYRDTNIVTVKANGDVLVATGGWNTPSTRRHILNALTRLGYKATLKGQKAIKGICISIEDFTDQGGVFFQSRGVFRKDRGVFQSDLGYTQTLAGVK